MKTIPSESRPSWPRNLGRYSAFLNYLTNLKNANCVIRFIISAKSILNFNLVSPSSLCLSFLFSLSLLHTINRRSDCCWATHNHCNCYKKKKTKKKIACQSSLCPLIHHS
jgi:hypothetical protein